MIRAMRKEDKTPVMNLIRRTEMFREDEIVVAEELIDRYLDDPAQKDYYIIVGESDEGAVTGYLCYGPTDLTEGTFDLYWMAVDPACQGSGWGKALLKQMEAIVEDDRGRMIIIETSSQPKYEPTRQFYLRQGCIEAARIADFYRPGEDRVIYIKRFHR